MPLHCPPLHHCPRTPPFSDVPSHCLNWHCEYPPHQDNSPHRSPTPYCKHWPPFKTVAWYRHINIISSPNNLLLRYASNLGNSRFFLLWYILYYHDGDLIQGQIIFAPILKTHKKEPPPPWDTLHHTIQLLPHPYWTTCPYLLLQLGGQCKGIATC